MWYVVLCFLVRFQYSYHFKSFVEVSVCSLNVLLEVVKDFVKNLNFFPRYMQCCSSAYLSVIMAILNFLVAPQQLRDCLEKAIVQQE